MKRKGYLSEILFSLLILVVAMGCGKTNGELAGKEENKTVGEAVVATATPTCSDTPTPEITRAPELIINMPESFDMHTEDQAGAVADDVTRIVYYAGGTDEVSAPRALEFSWEIANSEQQPETFEVKFWDDDTPERIIDYSGTRELKLYNLLLGHRYWISVSGVLPDGTLQTVTKDFVTADIAPRNLYVPGVANVRDLGHWGTADGKRIKQGMVFRSGRLNKNKSDIITIEEEGIRVFNETIGIKTELDLRMDEIRTESALGSGVNYINIPLSYNKKFEDLRKYDNQIRQAMEVFADESNYPILVHCSIGTDRTGLICWLLQGLCGVSEKDMALDYVFSNFSPVSGLRNYSDVEKTYVKQIKEFPGETLQDKVIAYLKEIGVSEETLVKISGLLKE